MPQAVVEAEAKPLACETESFAALLRKSFRPSTEEKQTAIEQAVGTLAEWALRNSNLLSDDTVASVKALIARIDLLLTAQLNAILHHPDFQRMESSWRGLHYLVTHTETDEMLKIRVLPIAKAELRSTLKKYKGTSWDQSPLFKRIYDEEYGVLGGEPYGCLVGDYYFDHSPPDVELLGQLAQIAAAAHAPIISAAAPSVFGMDSWQELSNPRDLTAIMSTAEYAAWNSLRAAQDSRYVGLTLPRFLARPPYGEKSEPVVEFAFEEDTDGGRLTSFCWANAAYAMAVNINRSFKLYGWCSQIRGVESGGAVEGLPTFTFPSDDGGVDMTCPTEIAIPDRREAELAKNGFMPLLHRKNSDFAVFIGAQSLQRPTEFDDKDASANAQLSARLPYLFAICRFAHYLKAMVRDKVGTSPGDTQKMLQSWLTKNYVHHNPGMASDAEKARKPLAAAEVIVTEREDNPGHYHAEFLLKPHYQLEGMTIALKLVSRLKSEKK